MSKKVVSAMLAFLLFVSNFMVSPVLAKENAENLSSESNICEICQQAECENTHENWCAECKQDDCDVEHGVQPDSLEQELQLIEVQEPAVEEQEPEVVEDVNPLIGKPVKFIVSYPYLWKDPSNVYDQIISNASVFPEVIYIEDVVAYSETITLYKLSVKGNNQWPSSYDGYYYVESTNVQIVEVQPDNICEICGTKDCVIEHVYCDYCKKYDCKVEHAICDACGNVDCQIQHVWCESCNKYDCDVNHDEKPFSITTEVKDAFGNVVTDNEGNPLSVTVSGEVLPEGAYTIVSTAQLTEELIYDLGLDANSYVFDIKVYDKFNSEWQPKNGEVIKIKLPVLSENNSGVVNAIHILDNPEQIEFAINQGIAKITNVSEFSSNTEIFLEKAISAWQKVSRSSDKCAAAIVTSNLQVIDGYVEFESNGFSYYYWNNGFVESTSSGYDSNNKVKYYENIWGSSSWQNGTIYVTRSNIYVETAINNRANWTSSSSYVTLAEKGEINILNGKARWARFVVDSKTPVGTSFTITANDVDGKSNRSIEFVVIEDRTIYFNANGGTCSTTSAVGMTDGKTHHRPVSLPSPSRTGYTFDGWYSAASGGNYVGVAGGSYVPGSNGETIYAHWTPINYTIRYNANGGTGSMADQSATYDQKLNFAMNSFTHPTPGYVFAGWSTSPTGGVVYTNGAETINLTSKSEVVNLYAVWVNAMEITDIRIGVNESYWFTNYMYTVTADNVNTPSYHRFPAEPAQQSIRYSRAIDDANGVWSITEDGVLYHNASYYINPSIVRSEYFEHSYITNQDTYGIADSTGVNTKAFLKFDDSDYQEIIKAWLKGMADSTSATPDANGEYTIVNKGSEYKTDINWKAEVNNWDEYEVIPYVIKLENSNAWRIDVVIAPTKLVTLSYNLNINTAVGYSLTGGSSIPNTQFERGSTQNVYSSVTSYNPNTKVSKNVGGVEYVAQFSHWEDEQGNKYGNGHSNSVLMDGNKTMKAIWIYPDQTQGALRIATDLTVPAGSGITPNMNQDFTLSVIFGTSGSYPYTKYSSTGLYQSNGTLNGTTGSFVLKPGEYVVISGVGSGVQYTVSESSVAGYTNITGTSDGKVKGSIQAGNTMSATIVNQRNAYTVTWQNHNGTVLETDLRVEYGSTPVFNLNDPVRPSSIQYDYHFIGWTPEISPVVEETVYTAQYESTLRKYTVKWYDGNNRLLKTDEVEFGTVPVYSGELPQKDSTVQYDFTFNNSWDKEVVAVTGNVEYVAQFDPVVRKYTVQWWNDINQNGQIDLDEIIEMDTVEYGSKPSYDSDTPVLETDEQYIYTFTCWLDEQSNLVNDDTIVVGNTIYKASYDTELVKYTVTIVYDSDQVVLEDDSRFIVVDGKLQAEFDYGSVVGVELTAVEGYRISGVTLNDVDLEIVSDYSLIVEQDLELVVESELIQYQVHFDANGGTGEMDSVTLTYDEELTLPSCEFTRDNYVFKGWSLDEDAEEGYLPDEKIKNLTSIHGQEIVLYAIWGVDEITLTIVTECNDSDQTYLFEVAGTSFDGQKTIHLTIALGANDSQKIIGIPPGIYSITDQSGWSWRYDSQSYWNQEIHEDQTFTFSYLQIKNEKGYWLNDYSIKEKEIRE